MKAEASVEIERPIAEVFEFTTRHVAEWSKTVVEEEILDEKPEGAGTTFRLVTEDHGCRMEFHGTVTRHEPPRLSAVFLRGKSFDIEAEYTFEDLGGRTRVTQRSVITPKGFAKAFFFVISPFMRKSGCKALKAELAELKRILESRPQPSQV